MRLQSLWIVFLFLGSMKNSTSGTKWLACETFFLEIYWFKNLKNKIWSGSSEGHCVDGDIN